MHLADERIYMNTSIHIQIYSNQGTIETQQMLEAAFDAFDYVVRKYTRFNSNSELSKLNDRRGNITKVDEEFFELIKKVIDISDKTSGAYDPTIIDLLELYGYKSKADYSELDDPGLLKKIKTRIKTRPSYKQVELNQEDKTIKLHPDQRIDLGSIGKGFAIDLASRALERADAFMINAGGDIRTYGEKPDGTDWQVGLYQSPLPNSAQENKLIGRTTLKNKALTASGGWVRRHRFFHHLISPTSGLPINNVGQTFVCADDATTADAWSTALFTMGEPGLELIKEEGLDAILIKGDGEILKTNNFDYYQ